MFDYILVKAGSASRTTAYYLAKPDRKGNRIVFVAKGMQAS
jgi:ribulose 1,5-bisphosphate synthetase/thiazole synthase